MAALQTEVVAQEVQPSRLTVWQRWSAVGRQLVERDMKGQVIQVGMIAGVVFARTLLQVRRCILDERAGRWWREALAETVEAAPGATLLMDTLQRQRMEVKHSAAPCAAEAGLPCSRSPAGNSLPAAWAALKTAPGRLHPWLTGYSEEPLQVQWAKGCSGSYKHAVTATEE